MAPEFDLGQPMAKLRKKGELAAMASVRCRKSKGGKKTGRRPSDAAGEGERSYIYAEAAGRRR